MVTIPDEIISKIFEYTGEYRYYPQFRKNKIVRSIFRGDSRSKLLESIPKKVMIKMSNIPPYSYYHVQVLFNIEFEDLMFRMSFKEMAFTESVSEDTGETIPGYKEYNIYFTKVDRRYTTHQSLKIYSFMLK